MQEAGLQDLVIVLITLGVIVYFAGGFKSHSFQRRDAPFSRFAQSTPGRNLRGQQLARDREERRDRHRHTDNEGFVPPMATDAAASDSEPVSLEGSVMTPETSTKTTPERTEPTQEEERARRAAAAAARFQKDKANVALAKSRLSERKAKKGLTPLEELSRENLGWRYADEAAEMRSWN